MKKNILPGLAVLFLAAAAALESLAFHGAYEQIAKRPYAVTLLSVSVVSAGLAALCLIASLFAKKQLIWPGLGCCLVAAGIMCEVVEIPMIDWRNMPPSTVLQQDWSVFLSVVGLLAAIGCFGQTWFLADRDRPRIYD